MSKGVKKTEYLRLIRRAETALRRELRKPDAERDEVLVEECLETLSYCRKQLAVSRTQTVRSFSFARAALTVAAVLVVTFALGATVAQAAGFRVWTAIFKHDAGYLRVDYVPENTALPVEYPAWADAERSFREFGEFRAELERNGFTAFLEEWNGYEFLEGGIRSTANEYYSSYSMTSDDGYIRVRLIAKRTAEESTSVWGLREEIPVVHIDVNGVDAAYQIDGDYAFATWQDETRIYSVSVYDRVDCVDALLIALISPAG
ncbi:MAG: DUF4367 domain-containing protein [Clostridia bacterium]|nr:DUF4367 domain-containing protein [Clostridia bacterium]